MTEPSADELRDVQIRGKHLHLLRRPASRTKSELTSTTKDLSFVVQKRRKSAASTPGDSSHSLCGSDELCAQCELEEKLDDPENIANSEKVDNFAQDYGVGVNSRILRTRSISSFGDPEELQRSTFEGCKREAGDVLSECEHVLALSEFYRSTPATMLQSGSKGWPSRDLVWLYLFDKPIGVEYLRKKQMSALKFEELYLLRLKSLIEIEKARRPKKQWWSFATPEFHYECRKNTRQLDDAERERARRIIRERRRELALIDRVAADINLLDLYE